MTKVARYSLAFIAATVFALAGASGICTNAFNSAVPSFYVAAK